MPERPLTPEVLEPDHMLPPDLLALRRFAILMDEAVQIPGLRKRIGLDAAIGLIPGVGDAIGAILSSWIVFSALRHRVPGRKVARMVGNIGLDLIVGSIPFVGDVFDFLFHENVGNVALLMRHRDRGRPPRSLKSIAGVVAIVASSLLLLMLLALAAVVAAAIWIIGRRTTWSG